MGPDPHPIPSPVDLTDDGPNSRRMLVETLSVAQSAVGATGDLRKAEHVGRLQWLITTIESGEGDVAWYAVGHHDAAQTAGDGRVRHMTTCMDPDTYAGVYNTGYEQAVAHGLTEDPEKAADWLADRDVRMTRRALIEAADVMEYEGSGDAAAWLRRRSDAIESSPLALDLEPFKEVLAEVEHRMRVFGGGTSDAYHNCAQMLRSAFRQYAQIGDES